MSDSEVASAWLGGMMSITMDEVEALEEMSDSGEVTNELNGLEWRVFGDFATGEFFAVGIFPVGGIQDFVIGGVEPLKLEGKTIPKMPSLDAAGVYAVAEMLNFTPDRVALGFHSAVSVY